MNEQVIDFARENGLKLDILENVRIFRQSMDYHVKDFTDGENIMISGERKYKLSETQFSGLHNAMNILSVAMVADEMRIPVERIGKYLSDIT